MNLFEELLKKGGEYYACAAHLHTRGLMEVKMESRKIVFDLKAQGKTYQDFEEYVVKNHGEPLNTETDDYLKLLVSFWSEHNSES